MIAADDLIACPECIHPHNRTLMTADPKCGLCRGTGEIPAVDHPRWCPQCSMDGCEACP